MAWGDLLWPYVGITWLTSNCFGQGLLEGAEGAEGSACTLLLSGPSGPSGKRCGGFESVRPDFLLLFISKRIEHLLRALPVCVLGQQVPTLTEVMVLHLHFAL